MDLSGLNDRQREAVLHGEGPLLVLAGAGSGKTRVITYRIGHLIERGVAPERILALSFTNKAAREVAERVRGLVGRTRAEGLTVSTFHALGLQILRAEVKRLGWGGTLSLHTESDQRALVRQVVRDQGLKIDPGEVQAFISYWKNQGIGPDGVPVGGAESQALRRAYRTYQDLLRAQRAVDFDDLLLLPLEIFRGHDDARLYWQERFHYILVDEYQDTNPVQFELLRVLAARRPNLTVVGDDDQAIYGWRGAKVELILRFEEHFPGARVVLLEENYRSTATVLDAAHAVVARIPGRRPKKLWTRAGPGRPLGWIEAADGADEAEQVASVILAERFRRRRPWSDFAVLYRTNAQSRPFEEVFRSHGIPHRVVGGTRFYDRKEVRDLLAYLKAVVNPRDEASLVRIANVPKRGLGPRTLLLLQERARQTGRTLRQVLREGEGLTGHARAGARALTEILDRFGRRFREEGLTASGLRDLIDEAGLRAEVEATYRSPKVVARRMEILDELAASVEDAPKTGGRVDPLAFIERLSLDPPSDEDEGGDEVTLMTLHGAKGLEFPVVFLAGMEEGLLPHRRDPEAPLAELDEERRLCYVGMTRAREELYLCHARARRRQGVLRPSRPSRFLAEIPAVLTEDRGPPPDEAEEKEMARNFFSGIRAMLE
ncbi:ATP-dependent helicase [Deferrisoma sp.]